MIPVNEIEVQIASFAINCSWCELGYLNTEQAARAALLAVTKHRMRRRYVRLLIHPTYTRWKILVEWRKDCGELITHADPIVIRVPVELRGQRFRAGVYFHTMSPRVEQAAKLYAREVFTAGRQRSNVRRRGFFAFAPM